MPTVHISMSLGLVIFSKPKFICKNDKLLNIEHNNIIKQQKIFSDMLYPGVVFMQKLIYASEFTNKQAKYIYTDDGPTNRRRE